MSLSPQERALRARIAGSTYAAKYGGADLSRRGRAGFRARFDREVDPDGVLDPAERKKRADAAYRAYMSRLALKSVTARRKASEARAAAVLADAAYDAALTDGADG